MSDTVSKQSMESILGKLEELQGLTGKKKEYQERLKKVENEKGTVSEKIYTKVKAEYERDLRSVIVQLSPLEEEMTRAKEELKQEMTEVEDKIGQLEEEINEVKFRQKVGEYSDEKLAQLTDPLDTELREIVGKKDEKMNILTKLNGVDVAPSEDVKSEPGNGETAEEEKFETIPSRSRPVCEENESVPGNTSSWEPPSAPKGNMNIDLILGRKNETIPSAVETESHSEINAALNSLADPSDEQEDIFDGLETSEETDTLPNISILSGTSAGKQIPVLPVTMSIGREHDNNIELKDSDVSRYHARILFRNGEYALEALDGSTGVWVNDKKCTNTVLQNDDMIRLGKTELRFNCEM